MRRRSLIIFVLLNVLISLGVAVGVISLLSPRQPESPVQFVTFEKIITATTDPNATPLVRIITATPLPGSIGVLPTGILDTPAVPITAITTFDAQALSVDAGLQGTATALPQNCILHTVQSGDTPFGIAEQYGADGFKVMEVNGLNEQTASLLQIGDVLIVPLEGCPLTAADIATEEPTLEASSVDTAAAGAETADSTAVGTARPTLTLPPTAANAQVRIDEVINPGDITSEGVKISNVGNTVNLKDWKLADSNGNEYVFSERFLFSNALVTVFSRVGQDTAIALFWNQSKPVFEPGDVVTLTDSKGVVQSTYRVPTPVNLP